MSATRRRLSLAVALALVGALLALVGGAAWRWGQPLELRATHLSNALWEPRFLDDTTLALVRQPLEAVGFVDNGKLWSETNTVEAEVWALDTGERLATRKIDRAFGIFREWVVRQPEDDADSLELWSLRTGQRERTFSLGKQRRTRPTLALSPSTELLAIENWSGARRLVEVRSTRDGKVVRSFALPDAIDMAARELRYRFSPREDRLLVEALDVGGRPPKVIIRHLVVVGSLLDGKIAGPIEPLPSRPLSADVVTRDAFFAHDDDDLLVVDRLAHERTVERHAPDGAVRWKTVFGVWDLTLPRGQPNDTGEPLEPDDRVAARLEHDGWAGVLDLHTGQLVACKRFSLEPDPHLRVAVSPSGERLAAASSDGRVLVWRVPR